MSKLLTQMTRTDPELIDRLKASASQPQTKEQRFAQKVSFVYGNQGDKMKFTRKEVEERLRNMD